VKRRKKSPREVKFLLAALGEEELVCVGGQCVNLWSLLYQQPGANPWKSLRPFTSYDVDAVADSAQMLRLSRRLQSRGWSVAAHLPRPDEAGTPNTGILVVRRGRFEIELDLLQTLKGLSAEEIRTRAVEIEWEGLKLRVLHPLLCVESKAHNLLSLPQDDPRAPRQDRKHLLLSVANLRQHLRAHTRDSSEASLLQTAERLTDFAIHQPGLDVTRLWGVDLLAAIPWAAWRRSRRPRLVRFARSEARVRRTTQTRIAEVLEFNEWLRKLKAKG
jgi:hypothetical protein